MVIVIYVSRNVQKTYREIYFFFENQIFSGKLKIDFSTFSAASCIAIFRPIFNYIVWLQSWTSPLSEYLIIIRKFTQTSPFREP